MKSCSKRLFKTKVSKVAVCKHTFALEGAEGFGLWGPNGAGKISTFKIIVEKRSRKLMNPAEQ